MASELGDFLKIRRSRLQPADVGLDVRGARRVPGLRREEVALVAGVSLAHYTRIEQGNATHVSDAVIDAVADALRLDAHERSYLHRLVRAPSRADPDGPEGSAVRPSLVALLEMMSLSPAMIVGHHTEVLGCNRLLVELIGPLPSTLSEAIFIDDYGVKARIAPSWETHAWHNVAFLRTSTAARPFDQDLADHIAMMRSASADFEDLWLEHDVVEWTYGERYLVVDHPDVGRLELSYEHLHVPGDESLYGLMAYTAPAGSPERRALEQLAARC